MRPSPHELWWWRLIFGVLLTQALEGLLHPRFSVLKRLPDRCGPIDLGRWTGECARPHTSTRTANVSRLGRLRVGLFLALGLPSLLLLIIHPRENICP